MNFGDWILMIMSFFFPPFTVAIKTGCTYNLCLSLLLTLLFYFPGLIYSWYIIITHPTITRDIRKPHPPPPIRATRPPVSNYYYDPNPNLNPNLNCGNPHYVENSWEKFKRIWNSL